MRGVSFGPDTWEQLMFHEACGTQWVAETEDLEVDRFKEPGTYWFNGTADPTPKFFVWCPAKDDLVFVDPETIPVLLRNRLLEGLK